MIPSLIIDGIAMGAIYGLVALAIVSIYRSTRVMNFAQGELAALSTYVTWYLLAKVPFWVSLLAGLGSGFAVSALLELALLRRIKERQELTFVIITVALFASINSIVLWIFGSVTQVFPSPFGEGVKQLGSVAVSDHTLGMLACAVLIMLTLTLFYRMTSVGLAMRATAQNWMAARLMGIRVNWMVTLAWGLAGMLGAAAGVLCAPKVFVFPNMMVAILVYAFASAVVGGLDSPVGAVAGGVIVGVLENLAGAWKAVGSDLKTVVALGLLVLILMVRPTGLFGRARARKV